MEKYVKAEMEIIELEAEDIIMTSGTACEYDGSSGFDGEEVCFVVKQ